MNPHKNFSLKVVLIVIFTAKLMVGSFFLAANFSPFNVFFQETVAIAQEEESTEAEEKEKKTSEESMEVFSKDARLALHSLEEKRLEIKKEEKRLEKQQAQLESLKRDVEEKIEELSKINQQIEDSLARKEEKEKEQEDRRKEAEESKIKQLVKVYTSMKPKTAAALIEKLDMDVVMKLFSGMKGEQIGMILSYVETNRAAQISEQLAKRNITAVK
jgi:flagellar motility protein MotE (MotC chaperone)